ncbi:MAG: competence/damage-inducible protein A [Candidatus Thorarchaeota archaeon]
MRAGILTIGDELLDGLVLDTNSNWIENRLKALSIEMHRLVAVRDNMHEIAEGLEFLLGACDVIITSGGLGPTHDDMTLGAIASALGLSLVENKDALAMVERQYKMLGEQGIVESSEITEPRKKMAMLPEGSIPLDNTVGGAPGVMIELAVTTIFCLPGVPAELKYVFSSSVEPWLEENATSKYIERIIEFLWKDESKFAPHIDTVMSKHEGVYIKSMPRRYGTTDILRVWVSARGSDETLLKELISKTIQSLTDEVGQDPSFPRESP